MSELSVPARLGAFTAGLAVVFAVAFGVGAATGDQGPAPAAPERSSTMTGGQHS